MPPSRLALSTFILLIINVTTALGSTVVVLDVLNREIAPDGITKSASLVEGKLPGPLISGNKGDTFEENVFNFLDDPSLNLDVSMSWHGIFQQNTNFADGVPGVTQCPIVEDNNFSYKFNATGQAGTFMYHGYSVDSPNDGTAGPLVIYDPNDPHALEYDYDYANTTIVLSDNYHNSTKALMTTYLSGEGNGKAPQPDSGLINGGGWYDGAFKARVPVIDVTFERSYRLRLVNTGISTAFFFSISQHRLKVIEVDGVSVQPVYVDSLRIDVGQRYSVVLNAFEINRRNQNYWIRAVMDTTCFPNPSEVYPFVYGIVHYHGKGHLVPDYFDLQLPLPHRPLNQTDLHPLIPVATPGKPRAGGTDFRAVLDLAFDNTTFRWTVNGKSWKPDANATLLQVLNGQTTFPNHTVIQLPAAGKSVELEINNKAPCPQPIHLTGHRFHVVSHDGVNFNYINPVIRDTVTVEANSKVVLRFVAGNPGVWSLYSQNQWYKNAGLLAQLISPINEITQNIHPPAEWYTLCPAFNQTGGSAA